MSFARSPLRFHGFKGRVNCRVGFVSKDHAWRLHFIVLYRVGRVDGIDDGFDYIIRLVVGKPSFQVRYSFFWFFSQLHGDSTLVFIRRRWTVLGSYYRSLFVSFLGIVSRYTVPITCKCRMQRRFPKFVLRFRVTLIILRQYSRCVYQRHRVFTIMFPRGNDQMFSR